MYTYHTHAATKWVAWSTLAYKKEENSVYNTHTRMQYIIRRQYKW